MILKTFGGVATDFNTTCLRPIKPLLVKFANSKREVFISKFPWQNMLDRSFMLNLNQPQETLNPATMVSKAGSDVWDKMLEATMNRVPNKLSGHIEILEVGGMRMISTVMYDKHIRPKVKILDYNVFEGHPSKESSYVQHEGKPNWFEPAFIPPKLLEEMRRNENAIRFCLYAMIVMAIAACVFLIWYFLGRKTLYAVILGCLIEYIETLATMKNCSDIKDKIPGMPPLPDTGFSMIPYLRHHDTFFTVMLFAPHFVAILLLLVILVVPKFRRNEKLRIYVLGGFFLIHLMRACTMHATILPSQLQGERVYDINAMFANTTSTNTINPLKDDPDLVFSGHTSTFLYTAFWFLVVFGKVNKKTVAGVAVLSALYGIMVISCRYHYSVDVIVAYFISGLLCVAMYLSYTKQQNKKQFAVV
jgi:hypothetical protein